MNMRVASCWTLWLLLCLSIANANEVTLALSTLDAAMQLRPNTTDLRSAVYFSLQTGVFLWNAQDAGGAPQAAYDWYTLLSEHYPGAKCRETFKELVQAADRDAQQKLTIEKIKTEMKWQACEPPAANPIKRYDQTSFSKGPNGCGNSGYSNHCSMWLLFHTLVSSVQDDEALRVMLVIRSYMQFFFACTDCAQHFQEMAVSLEVEVTDRKSAVVWLWRAHNRVNYRLDHPEDGEPDQFTRLHPPFPLSVACPECIDVMKDQTSSNSTFETAQVFAFLQAIYLHEEDIFKLKVPAPPKPPPVLPCIATEYYNDCPDSQAAKVQSKAEGFSTTSIVLLSGAGLVVILFLLVMFLRHRSQQDEGASTSKHVMMQTRGLKGKMGKEDVEAVGEYMPPTSP